MTDVPLPPSLPRPPSPNARPTPPLGSQCTESNAELFSRHGLLMCLLSGHIVNFEYSTEVRCVNGQKVTRSGAHRVQATMKPHEQHPWLATMWRT